MLDSYYDLTRHYVIIKYTGKNLETTRIFDIRIRVLKYGYDYVTEVLI